MPGRHIALLPPTFTSSAHASLRHVLKNVLCAGLSRVLVLAADAILSSNAAPKAVACGPARAPSSHPAPERLECAPTERVAELPAEVTWLRSRHPKSGAGALLHRHRASWRPWQLVVGSRPARPMGIPWPLNLPARVLDTLL